MCTPGFFRGQTEFESFEVCMAVLCWAKHWLRFLAAVLLGLDLAKKCRNICQVPRLTWKEHCHPCQPRKWGKIPDDRIPTFLPSGKCPFKLTGSVPWRHSSLASAEKSSTHPMATAASNPKCSAWDPVIEWRLGLKFDPLWAITLWKRPLDLGDMRW